MTVIIIIFYLFIILIYAVICLIAKKDIERKIKGYEKETIWKVGIVDHSLSNKLDVNQKKIITFGAIGWPMYYLFCMGASLGSDIYNLLIGDDYEDRIATWFV